MEVVAAEPVSARPPLSISIFSFRFLLPASLPSLVQAAQLAVVGSLEGGKVDLTHLKHGLHGPARLRRVRIMEQLEHGDGDDLPGQAEFVFEPAALALLSAG